jgi:hypothetical protein
MAGEQLGADLITALEARGWTFARSTSREPLLPPEVSRRYPRVAAELIAFLESLESGVNADETVWFLCREDFRRTDDQAFRWNEFERMVSEDAPPEDQQRTRQFWDRHFPFMLCVHSDYDYLAVDLDARAYGAIVHGCGPAFEETSLVAPSFERFVKLFKDAVSAGRDDYPLGSFM